MVGCQLPEQDCASIDEITNIPIEIVTLKSHIDLSNDAADIVTHTMDSTNKIVINPATH